MQHCKALTDCIHEHDKDTKYCEDNNCAALIRDHVFNELKSTQVIKPEWCGYDAECCLQEEPTSDLCADCEFYELKTTQDMVNHPDHYRKFPIEVIEMIKALLIMKYGEDGYEAYCFGNELKYRMRAGIKGDIVEDIKKAMKYMEFRKK